MRYQKNQKDTTRQKIIDVAARLFKVNGTDASGVATIMKEAGLTSGAFYAHFASKDSLVEAVISDQLYKQHETFKQQLKNNHDLDNITTELMGTIKNNSTHKKQFTLALFGLLIGTLQLARTVTDESLAKDILKGGRETALSLVANNT